VLSWGVAGCISGLWGVKVLRVPLLARLNAIGRMAHEIYMNVFEWQVVYPGLKVEKYHPQS